MKIGHLAALAALATLTAAVAGCDRHRNDGAAQKTAGKIESAAGALTGNDDLKSQGKQDQVVGSVKNAVGDVQDAVGAATK